MMSLAFDRKYSNKDIPRQSRLRNHSRARPGNLGLDVADHSQTQIIVWLAHVGQGCGRLVLVEPAPATLDCSTHLNSTSAVSLLPKSVNAFWRNWLSGTNDVNILPGPEAVSTRAACRFFVRSHVHLNNQYSIDEVVCQSAKL